MFEAFKSKLRDTEVPLASLPVEVAKAIRTESGLTVEQKKEAVELVREWAEYVKENNVVDSDLYMLRAHLEAFAERFSLNESEEEEFEILESDVTQFEFPDGSEFETLFANVTHPDIVTDERTVVYGGAARVALKVMGGASQTLLDAEFPLSDIDYMVIGNSDIESVVSKYGGDLTGTKIIPDFDNVATYLRTVDLTMNQAVIHNGKIYYTRQALSDATYGIIRSVGKEKPLFGRDSIMLDNGEAYMLPSGFYRAMIALARGRGNEIVVSQENIDGERERIGKYWLATLFVKLIKMLNCRAKDEAVLRWYQGAYRIGSTKATNPADFFTELVTNFPNFRAGIGNQTFDVEAQTRWLIGKLVSRGKEKVIKERVSDGRELPSTYTPANITLPPYEGSRDLTEFWKRVEDFNNLY